jgi:molybdopterin/thiamine biosynthesis adenylyltransferase
MDRTVVDLEDHGGRYDRQELITWWDQDRLRSSRVLVVGAGALGNEIVKNLTLLGIGSIVVIDMDTVENSNLARCVFFREGDEGRLKAEVVAEAAHRMNPDVQITPVVGDVRTAFGLGAYRDFDLVIGGLDNREARLHVNRSCWKTATPWIDGAIEGLMGVMRVFVPGESACYECTLSEADFKILAQRRACSLLSRDEMLAGKVPTTITSASVIAGMQAQEAVKLLHRDALTYDFAGKGVAFNGMTHDSYTVTYAESPNCLSHDTYSAADWQAITGDETLGGLLAMGGLTLGGEVVLDFEHDVVLSLQCAQCESSEPVMQPLDAVSAGRGVCPECGSERTPTIVHSVDSNTDAVLLGARPADLGLPPADVITARSGTGRTFFVLPDQLTHTGGGA